MEEAAFQTADVSYTRRDLILYALGVGCIEPRHTFEDDNDFQAFPLFPASLLYKGMSTDLVAFPSPTMLQLSGGAESQLDGMRAILDAERFIERFKILPAGEGTHELTMRSRLVGIAPKRNGALLHYEGELRDASGELLYRMDNSAYALGACDASASGRSISVLHTPPDRPRDACHVERISAQQAMLYRLCGDTNPLHIDAETAALQGFERPILHGMCTLAFAVRAVLRLCAGGDPACFRSVRARFVGSVMPGQRVRTSVWAEGCRVLFVTEVLPDGEEGAKLAIGNACVELTVDARLAEDHGAGPISRL